MSTWTTDAVIALAPDASSAKSAQGLASARKWTTLGRDEISLWGEIKGSGSSPYQARIDLREPAFKCSCPSRKFPCKHGLALLLVLVGEETAFAPQAAPPWVSEWLADRQKRSERKESAKTAATAPEPGARARRMEQRDRRIDGGLDQLHLWMGDLVRMGLASARTQPSTYWNAIAARLVDAQAPGLGRMVRKLEESIQSGLGWEDLTLHGLARLELVRRACKRANDLPASLTAEVRATLGIHANQEQLDAVCDVTDRWVVLGWTTSVEDRLTVRRTWLHGEQSRRAALILDFAIGSQTMPPPLAVGKAFDAIVAFYPSGSTLRAQIKQRAQAGAKEVGLPGHATFAEAMSGYADALAGCPWLERYPMSLTRVRIAVEAAVDDESEAYLLDVDDIRIRLPRRCLHAWHLLAISGGREIGIFGEWDGMTLNPLSAHDGAHWYALSPNVARLQKV